MDYLAYGWSVEEMCRQHPYLTLSEAHAAMAYYFDNQDEIDREIRVARPGKFSDSVARPGKFSDSDVALAERQEVVALAERQKVELE